MLLGFLVASFIALTTFAWLRPGSRFWQWVDPPYYLLAAISLALIFYGEAEQRELNSTTLELREAEQRLANLQAQVPKVNFTALFPSAYRDGYETLREATSTADACRFAANASGFCAAAMETGEDVGSLISELGPPPTPSAAVLSARYSERYCKVLDRILANELRQPSLARPIYEVAKDQIEKLGKSSWSPEFSEPLYRGAEAVRFSSDEYVEKTYPKMHGGDRVFARDYLRRHADFAVDLYYANAPCSQQPANGRDDLRAFAAWESQEKQSRQKVEGLARRVKALREDQAATAAQVLMRWMRSNLWPYLLAAALAMKFAKSIIPHLPRRPRSVPGGEGALD